MTTTEPGAVADDVPGPDLDLTPAEPLHPDDHISFAVQLLETGQELSAQGDQDDLDVRAMCALLAAGAHAQIATYELLRRGAATEGLISADYRGPDLDH